MLPNGTTFSAALLELGHVERSPYAVSLDNSANVSYATSSINGPDESPVELTHQIAAGQLVKAAEPATGQDITQGIGAVEGLPKVHGKEGYDGAYGDFVISFEMPAEGEGKHASLGVPAISHRDAQAIRDILLGKVKAPNHVSAGVGIGGGFLSLAPEWQR